MELGMINNVPVITFYDMSGIPTWKAGMYGPLTMDNIEKVIPVKMLRIPSLGTRTDILKTDYSGIVADLIYYSSTICGSNDKVGLKFITGFF